MSDIKLFRLAPHGVSELDPSSYAVERSLQSLIEQHLYEILGIDFLATEYSTGPVHGGRIDTLGLDENGCPVIIEYKRSTNENVINQGLFYLDWLMDHKDALRWLVLQKLGDDRAKQIDWSAPRLLCIAGDYTKYDGHAVQQINRNIELLRYRLYGNDLLLLELVNAVSLQPAQSTSPDAENSTKRRSVDSHKSVSEYLEMSPPDLRNWYAELEAYILALGDDVQMRELKYYYAFRRIRNFACIQIQPREEKIVIYVKVNPDDITTDDGFTRDVRNIGHFGTGDLEITITSQEQIDRAKALIERSYEIG